MAEEQAATDEKRISVAKIYIKDFSFESPQSPTIFRAEKWSPQTNLNLRSGNKDLGDGVHEVILTLTVDAKEDDKTVFLVELQQAGLFEMTGYEDSEISAITGSYCPSILFPYAREAIANVIQKGGFPEFMLQPINFEALYLQAQQQSEAEAESETAEKH